MVGPPVVGQIAFANYNIIKLTLSVIQREANTVVILFILNV